MKLQSINPATEEVIAELPEHTPAQIETALARAAATYRAWRTTSFAERSRLMRDAGAYLRTHRERLAATITTEMGKPIAEAEGEIDKCAWNCDYYADNAEAFLADEPTPSGATESYVAYRPIGAILEIMPWNFPFWQVFRHAAPALMAGNVALLKHASNVPQCALAIEEVFRATGFPEGAFTTLLTGPQAIAGIIADDRIAAVTLTGSDAAGASVAEAAGRAIKKVVLELGGSDPFIVLADADLDAAAMTAVRARYQNSGQSCIAAKRFIVEAPVLDAFTERFVAGVRALRTGDPMQRDTNLGPLARADLRDALDRQVAASKAAGGRVLTGGARIEGRGYYYEPTVVTDVTPAAPVFCEETFGPVAAVISAKNADDAIRLANDSPYGLGAALWTRDIDRARVLAGRIESGQVFVNGMVASDPRLPFGGVKRSGYGRELGVWGMREFANVQTVWIGPPR